MDREVFQEQFGLLGESEAIKQVIDKVMQVAPTDITVLLQGESGVGKDVTARAIHAMSERKRGNLVIVNCGAIPEGIIESELFGHEKGSFTGATETREGYFEKADNGTIFLDEIGDTPKNIQVKLLRVLENGEYSRVGSSKVRKTDVRVIAATNKDLWELVQDGSFREDLYYRLDTVKIKLPPLRDRAEDIIPLFRKFVQDFSSKYDSVFKGFSDEARNLLTSYRWPGNIRELRNVAEQLVVLEKSKFVDAEKLQKYLKGRQHTGSTDNLPILSTGEKEQHNYFGSDNRDRELIYRALVELRADISDIKTMVGNLFYASMNIARIEIFHIGIGSRGRQGFDIRVIHGCIKEVTHHSFDVRDISP
jgi:transcriptional regulator with GAF, ATPase, and Fis domain